MNITAQIANQILKRWSNSQKMLRIRNVLIVTAKKHISKSLYLPLLLQEVYLLLQAQVVPRLVDSLEHKYPKLRVSLN